MTPERGRWFDYPGETDQPMSLFRIRGLCQHPANNGKKFFSDHISGTCGGSTTAGEIHEVFEAVPVVKGQFLSARYWLDREYPDSVVLVQIGFAIGFATVVNQARGIPTDFAVQIRGPVHREEIAVLFQAQLSRLVL